VAILPQAKGGEKRTIVIVGAGIGGLTAALTLAAANFRVIVVERADHLSEVGAGIQLAPNATRVLDKLGLSSKIAAAAIEPEAIDIRSGVSGKPLAAIPGAAYRARYGMPYYVIHRADLQRLLAGAVEANANVTLHLAATIAQTLPQTDGLLVRIQKPGGVDVVPAVAIVAADGVWSTFRGKIAGSAKPEPTGRTAWRALVAADVARSIVSMQRVGLWLGKAAHLVHYPVAQGAAVNIVAIVDEVWDRPGWSAVGERAEIMRRFQDWPARARHIIAAPVSWQKFAINRVNPGAPWTDDRTALLGDAAHAMEPYLAQGAAMAIEDAAVLAARLENAADIPAALRAYETDRKPRVAAVARAANLTGRRYHYAGPLAFARDMALRYDPERFVLDQNDWIYRWQPSGG
jgi:salicylate hydroxylase